MAACGEFEWWHFNISSRMRKKLSANQKLKMIFKRHALSATWFEQSWWVTVPFGEQSRTSSMATAKNKADFVLVNELWKLDFITISSKQTNFQIVVHIEHNVSNIAWTCPKWTRSSFHRQTLFQSNGFAKAESHSKCADHQAALWIRSTNLDRQLCNICALNDHLWPLASVQEDRVVALLVA